MRLLFDQNLSFKLAAALEDVFPGSTQVRLLGLDRADDLTVWFRARRDGYVLVTQDADFRDISLVLGAPPKVVLLRCGNRSTLFVEALLRRNAPLLSSLEAAADLQVLEVG